MNTNPYQTPNQPTVSIDDYERKQFERIRRPGIIGDYGDPPMPGVPPLPGIPNAEYNEMRIAQLERIDDFLIKREKVISLYRKRLENIEDIILPQIEENKKMSWFIFIVRLTEKYQRKDRDLILSKLKEKGIHCNSYFSPIHLQPFYTELFNYKRGDFPITEEVSDRTIALPFYNNLKEDQIDFICKNFKSAIHSL